MTPAAPGQIDPPIKLPFAAIRGALEGAFTHIGDRPGSCRTPEAEAPTLLARAVLTSQASSAEHARQLLARSCAESHQRPP